MSFAVHQPNLTEGLSLIGWRLKRDAEIQARKDEANFECKVEPSSTSYAAFEYTSTTDDNYDPYNNLNLDLCLEVDAIDLNDDYDPYETFMQINSRRTIPGHDRPPLALLPSQTTLGNNYRHYNFADDDTPVKYPLAIGFIDKRLKQQNMKLNNKRVTFDDDRLSRRIHSNQDFDDDIAPTVTEMDMLEDEEDNQPITKSYSSLNKNFSDKLTTKRINNLYDEEYQTRKRSRFDEYDRIPARRGRPPSSSSLQEDSAKKTARIISQFEEQHGLKLGEMRVFAPKLRLRISSVNVNWINLPPIPNFPNKVHQS